METYLFMFFASLAIACALGVVLSRDTINSALFLIGNLLATAGIFLLLKAQFIAIIQVLIYGGAIMVLFLFVIMLLNLGGEEKILSKFRVGYFFAFLFSVLILAQLLYTAASFTGTLPVSISESTKIGTIEHIGDVLFTTYLLPVLVTAVFLTGAVAGALFLAQRKIPQKKDASNGN